MMPTWPSSTLTPKTINRFGPPPIVKLKVSVGAEPWADAELSKAMAMRRRLLSVLGDGEVGRRDARLGACDDHDRGRERPDGEEHGRGRGPCLSAPDGSVRDLLGPVGRGPVGRCH